MWDATPLSPLHHPPTPTTLPNSHEDLVVPGATHRVGGQGGGDTTASHRPHHSPSLHAFSARSATHDLTRAPIPALDSNVQPHQQHLALSSRHSALVLPAPVPTPLYLISLLSLMVFAAPHDGV